MSWLSYLNPLNWLKILSYLKAILDAVAKLVSSYKEGQARKEDEKKSDAAIDELEAVKPDPTKTEAENAKAQEDAWDKYYDSFKR